MSSNLHAERGSVYVLTLFTVAAVGSMVVIGVAARSGVSAESSIVERMNKNSLGVLSAAEVAIAQVQADPKWAVSAQSGTVFKGVVVGESTYDCAVIDADTQSMPTSKTESYQLFVSSTHGLAHESAQIILDSTTSDYQSLLEPYGLSAYWPMNEESGIAEAAEPIDKRVGNYLEPKIVGSSSTENGGFVPEFQNSNDHVETAYDTDYWWNTEGAMSMWLRLNGESKVTTYGILGQKYLSYSLPAVTLTCTAGSLHLWMPDNSDDKDFDLYIAQTDHSLIVPGQWHHVAFSWGSMGIKIHIDGEKIVRNPDVWAVWHAHSDSRYGMQPLMVGAGYIPSMSSQPLTGFDGSIARVAMFDTQLSNAQISEIAAIVPDLRTVELREQSWAHVAE